MASGVNPRTDILLSMAHTPTEDYMQMIVDRTKNYEFRKKLYPATVERIWFYETSPTSAVTYICEVGPAVLRTQESSKPTRLVENGIGNKEFNEHHPDWQGYDHAYLVRSCYRIRQPISLEGLKGYGIKGAPRGMVYVPISLMEEVAWDEQEMLWTLTA